MNHFDSSIPLITLTKEGCVAVVNEEFTRIFGYKIADKLSFFDKFSRLSLEKGQSEPLYIREVFQSAELSDSGVFCYASLEHLYHYFISFRMHVTQSSLHTNCFDVRFFEIQNKGVDAVTGLHNGWAITSQYNHDLKNLGVEKLNLGYFIFAVDNYSSINFRFGYQVGDDYLIKIGQAVQQIIGTHGFVIRYHNARFGVLIRDESGQPQAHFEYILSTILNRFKELFSKPIHIADDIQISKTFSLGAAINWRDYKSFFEMDAATERAFFISKSNGDNSINYASTEYAKERILQKSIADLLPQAIENLEIDIHFQPQFSIASNTLIGFEALARWQTSDAGFISPLDFVGTANRLALNVELDMCILMKVAMQVVAWQSAEFRVPRVAVNMSTKTLQSNLLVQQILSIMKTTQCSAHNIEIEITETDKVTDSFAMVNNLKQLQQAGFIFSMDDFGTGYSSLSLLRTLDFALDKIKLDIELTEKVCQEVKDQNFIKQIIDLGKILNIKVLAEGVEEQAQKDALLDMGCDYAQGYYFSRPLHPTEAVKLLKP